MKKTNPPAKSAAGYFYPNVMGRIILLAMEEILGRNGLNAVLNLASVPEYIDHYPPHNHDLHVPFEHVSRLQGALEAEYGPRGGRGLALRSGRACFTYGLREFGAELGLTDLAFRLLPLPAKLKAGSEAFAGLFNHFSDQRVRLENDGQNIIWRIERCPLCWQRQASEPACHLAVGLLQEALYWVSGGRYFNVTETECIACGDATCAIVIDPNPMA
jgi:predicted hydrocarbon binding protein